MTIDKERLRVLASDCTSHPLSQHIAEIEEAGEGLTALLSEIAALEKREQQALQAASVEAKLFDEERQKNAALAAEVERLRKDAARYCAFRDAGLPITFLGVDYYDKPSLDAAIDAAMADKGAPT